MNKLSIDQNSKNPKLIMCELLKKTNILYQNEYINQEEKNIIVNLIKNINNTNCNNFNKVKTSLITEYKSLKNTMYDENIINECINLVERMNVL